MFDKQVLHGPVRGMVIGLPLSAALWLMLGEVAMLVTGVGS